MARRKEQLPVCFLCLKRISAFDLSNQDLDNERENKVIISKFWLFTKQHLEVSIKELVGDVGGNSFCGGCAVFVRLICELYESLCSIQVQLAEKLGQLADLMEGSKEEISGKMVNILMRTLAGQLGLKEEEDVKVTLKKVEEMRTLLARQCKLHSCPPPLFTTDSIEGSKAPADDSDCPEIKEETASLSGNDCDNDDDTIDTNWTSFEVQDEDNSSGDDSQKMKTDCDKDWERNEDDESDGDFSSDESQNNDKDKVQKPKKPKRSSSSSSEIINLHTCNHCQKTYKKQGHLHKHLFQVHGIGITPTKEVKFACEVCNKQYSTKYALIAHNNNIHSVNRPPSNRTVPCTKCPKKFKTKASWQGHMKYAHNLRISIMNMKQDNPIKCDICGKGSYSEYNKRRHMKDVHKIDTISKKLKQDKRVKCDICGKGSSSECNKRRHMRTVHKIDQISQKPENTQCPHCSKEFATRRLLTYHIYEVHKKEKKTLRFMERLKNAKETSDDNVETCAICGESFETWDSLYKHLASKHEGGVTENKRMCYFCSQTFTHEQTVWAHLRSCSSHNLTKIEFPCDHEDHLGYPQWSYKKPEQLEQHFKEDHQTCNILKCGDCGHSFLDKNMLDLHRLVHLPKVNKKYQCRTCGNYFTNTGTLQNHFNMVHGANLRIYRCLVCTLGFSSIHGFKVHKKIHEQTPDPEVGDHQNDNQFSCSQCSNKYPTKIQLRDHVRGTHQMKQCEDCGIILSKVRMTYHVKHHHGKGRDHVCSACGKVYKSPVDLKQHMSSHGQYPVYCQYCGKGSRNGGHLRRHIGRMHKDKVVEK